MNSLLALNHSTYVSTTPQPSIYYQKQLVEEIDQWIGDLILKHKGSRKSCSYLSTTVKKYFPDSFLNQAYFVFVDEIPIPNHADFKKLITNNDLYGITYRDTYFLKYRNQDDLRHHFHELVHVKQWSLLGSKGFIHRYINEVQEYGYQNAPLETIAKECESMYFRNEFINNILGYIEDRTISSLQ